MPKLTERTSVQENQLDFNAADQRTNLVMMDATTTAADRNVLKVIEGLSGEQVTLVKKFFYHDVARFLRRLNELNTDAERAGVRVGPVRKMFREEYDRIIDIGEVVVKEVEDRRVAAAIKEVFRDYVKSWYRENPYIRRGLEKPCGYAGDYMMMEMGYQRRTENGALRGELDRYCFDRYRCIAERKETIKQYLRRAIEDSDERVIRILTLGGGPCREWMELDEEIERSRIRVNLTYIDQDVEAVEFSRARLNKLALVVDKQLHAESLLAFRDSRSWKRYYGKFRFIYALGIADYFPDKLLVDICEQALRLLAPSGEFLITHKDKGRFAFPFLDWLCNWNFVHRDEADLRRIVGEAAMRDDARLQLITDRDRTGEVIFVIAAGTDSG